MFKLCEPYDAAGLPAALLQRYPSADGAALKVALFFLVNGGAGEAALCAELGLSADAAKRALAFWSSVGLICDGDTPAKPAPKQKLLPARRHVYQDEMAVALLGDPQLASLLQESQRLLGRELSVSESRLLLEIAGEQELPAAVVLILESYWATALPAKKVLTETARSAKEWNALGIRTADAAEKQVALMELRRQRHAVVAKLLGRSADDLTRAERNRIDEWFERFGYGEAFISEVLLRKPDATVAYVHAVFRDWNKKGYRSLSDTRTAPVNAQPAAAQPEEGSVFQRALAKNNRKKES